MVTLILDENKTTAFKHFHSVRLDPGFLSCLLLFKNHPIRAEIRQSDLKRMASLWQD